MGLLNECLAVTIFSLGEKLYPIPELVLKMPLARNVTLIPMTISTLYLCPSPLGGRVRSLDTFYSDVLSLYVVLILLYLQYTLISALGCQQ